MENIGVTNRQMQRMVFLEAFALGAVFMPHIAAEIYKGAAMTMLAGLICVFLFGGFLIWISGRQGYFHGVMSFDGRLIHFVYALRFFLRAVVMLFVFFEIVNRFLLPDDSRIFILLPLSAVCCYACLRTIKDRARLLELLFWWIVVPIIAIWLFSLSGWHVELLSGQTIRSVGGQWGQTLHTIYKMLLCYLPLEGVLYVMPKTFAAENEAHDGDRASAMKAAFYGLILALIFHLAIFCMAFFIVGENSLSTDIFSVCEMMQMITVPGNVVARLDIIALPFLILGLFIIFSGSVFYGCRALEYALLKRPSGGVKIPVIVSLLVLAASLCCGSFSDVSEWYVSYGMWIDLPLAFILPLICLLGTNTEKKKCALCLLLCCTLLFGGCSKIDIEDKDYVLMLGIDAVKGETTVEKETYAFSAAMADMQGYKAETGESVKMKTTTAEKQSLEAFGDSYSRNHATTMDFGHVKLLLINEDIAKDTDRLSGLLALLEEEGEVSATVIVAVTTEAASDYIKMDQDSEMVLSDAILNMLEGDGNVACSLQDLYRTFGEGGALVLPELEMSETEELPVIASYITVTVD